MQFLVNNAKMDIFGPFLGVFLAPPPPPPPPNIVILDFNIGHVCLCACLCVCGHVCTHAYVPVQMFHFGY